MINIKEKIKKIKMKINIKKLKLIKIIISKK